VESTGVTVSREVISKVTEVVADPGRAVAQAGRWMRSTPSSTWTGFGWEIRDKGAVTAHGCAPGSSGSGVEGAQARPRAAGSSVTDGGDVLVVGADPATQVVDCGIFSSGGVMAYRGCRRPSPPYFRKPSYTPVWCTSIRNAMKFVSYQDRKEGRGRHASDRHGTQCRGCRGGIHELRG
jgi:hypothetical protein